jgi:hypothetical protein
VYSDLVCTRIYVVPIVIYAFRFARHHRIVWIADPEDEKGIFCVTVPDADDMLMVSTIA